MACSCTAAARPFSRLSSRKPPTHHQWPRQYVAKPARPRCEANAPHGRNASSRQKSAILNRSATPIRSVEVQRSLGGARSRNGQSECRRHRILAERLDRIQRQLRCRPGSQRWQLLEHGSRRGNDVASHFVGLDHVEDLARRRPDDLDIGRPACPRDRVTHNRPIIDANVGEPSGKHRYASRRACRTALRSRLPPARR